MADKKDRFDVEYVVLREPHGCPIGIYADHSSAYEMFLSVTRGVKDAKYEDYVFRTPRFLSWSMVEEIASEVQADDEP